MRRKFSYHYCVQCGGRLARKMDAHGDTRLTCRRCGSVEYQSPKPTAALLLTYRNELLLVKRARPPFNGWWDLPGGFVERGEGLETALRREVKEELGIQLSGFTFVGSQFDVYGEGEPVLGAYFTKRVSRKPIIHPADDVSEAQWFHLRALPPRIAFAGQRMVIRRFRAHILD